MTRQIIGLLLISSTAFSLETQPWLGNQYEFDFESLYIYSHFRKVEGAVVQPPAPTNVNNLFFDIGFTPKSNFDIRAEIEFVETTYINFNWRSVAIQGRYQWLDDISGDPVSLTTGLNMRGVHARDLHYVSSPWASNANFELSAAVGKEWSSDGDWKMRTYGYATIGMANRSYPWSQQLLTCEWNWQNRNRLYLYGIGYEGFGGKQHIRVNHFDGWGKVQHQSIDLGIGYRYNFTLWGTLSIFYAYRVFAHNYPEHVNFAGIEYKLPFSLF